MPTKEEYTAIKKSLPESVLSIMEMIISTLKSLPQQQIINAVKSKVSVVDELKKSTFGKTILKIAKNFASKHPDAEKYFTKDTILTCLYFESPELYNVISKLGDSWFEENIYKIKQEIFS